MNERQVMKHRLILPSAMWCQHTSAGHPVTPILSRVLPYRCNSLTFLSPPSLLLVPAGHACPCQPDTPRWSLLSPMPVGWQAAGGAGRGSLTPPLYGAVAILALLCPGTLGLRALFIQLLWSNKSKKCVFIGFVVCLSLITFLCVLASLFYFSDWQRPPALQPCGLFCWCWAVFVDLWKWFSKNNI